MLRIKALSIFQRDSLAYRHLITSEFDHEEEMQAALLAYLIAHPGYKKCPPCVFSWLRDIAARPGEWRARKLLWLLHLPTFNLMPEEDQKFAVVHPEVFAPYAGTDLLNALPKASSDVISLATKLCETKEIPDPVRAIYQTALGICSAGLCVISSPDLLCIQANSFLPTSRPAFDWLIILAKDGNKGAWYSILSHLDTDVMHFVRSERYHEDIFERIDLVDEGNMPAQARVSWQRTKEWRAGKQKSATSTSGSK